MSPKALIHLPPLKHLPGLSRGRLGEDQRISQGRTGRFIQSGQTVVVRVSLGCACSSHAPCSSNKEKQHDGANGRANNLADQSTARCDVKIAKEEAANKGADDSDDNIAEQTEASAAHDIASKPAGYGADEQPNEQGF